jgi:hypothetical protein
MSTKQIVVVKSGVGCRILVNPDPGSYENDTHCINPDLRKVRGVPPEQWSIVDGTVLATVPSRVPATKYANEDALWAAIDAHGADALKKHAVLLGRIEQAQVALDSLKVNGIKILAAAVVLNTIISKLL